MVRYIKLTFLIVYLFSSFFKNVFSLESAVHRAEVAKCVNLSSLIYNSNPISENLSLLALHVHKLSLIKAENLELSLSSEDDEKIRRSVCMLALSCGRCHAAFRKVRYSNLRKEGRGWTGNYESCWKYKNEITLDSTSIRK